jgi:ABC-type branched-subunit amino acid transport system ATPase component
MSLAAAPQAGLGQSPILNVAGISVRFGGVLALNDVHLRVAAGELRAVLGPNGAGKTTLFNAIAGTVRPLKGKVTLGDRDVTGLPPYRIHQLGVARAFQTPAVFGALPVVENVWLGTVSGSRARWNPFRSTSIEARTSEHVCEAIELVGLGHVVDRPAASLSHADQKLLDIAIAYASRPDVLLLDEPTQGVSPADAERIAEVIATRLRTATILMIEHNVDTVLAIADLVAVLDHGSVIAEGPPRVVMESEAVQVAYLGATLESIAAAR